MTYYWPYAVTSSNICGFFFTGMPWSTCNQLILTTKSKQNVFFLQKRRTIIDRFEGLRRGHVFATIASLIS